jgi:transcriptional regulator with XRE-family HTH domain
VQLSDLKKRDLKKHVGKVIKYLRLKAEMGQDALAEAAGIHRTHVGLIERAQHLPSLDVLIRLAKGLGMTTAKLVAEIEDVDKEVAMPPALPKGRPKTKVVRRPRVKPKDK